MVSDTVMVVVLVFEDVLKLSSGYAQQFVKFRRKSIFL